MLTETEARELLAQAAADIDVSATDPFLESPPRRRWWLVPAIAAAVTVGVTLSGLALSRDDGTSDTPPATGPTHFHQFSGPSRHTQSATAPDRPNDADASRQCRALLSGNSSYRRLLISRMVTGVDLHQRLRSRESGTYSPSQPARFDDWLQYVLCGLTTIGTSPPGPPGTSTTASIGAVSVILAKGESPIRDAASPAHGIVALICNLQ